MCSSTSQTSIILPLLILLYSSVCAVDNCAPQCATGDTKTEDPNNCRQFYFCDANENPSASPYSCADGEIFDPLLKNCVVGETCTNTGCRNCYYKCTDPNVPSMADHYDCSVYTDCESNTKFTCTAGHYFDGSSCQTDESKCCSCKPYCTDNDQYKLVIDPEDCTRYYYCEADDSIPKYSAQCSSGNFDILTGQCSDSAPCTTFCTNVVHPDGCIEIYTCETQGNHPKCPQRCDPNYYHCSNSQIGQVVTADTCGTEYYNPDTDTCVTLDNCPYPLPENKQT